VSCQSQPSCGSRIWRYHGSRSPGARDEHTAPGSHAQAPRSRRAIEWRSELTAWVRRHSDTSYDPEHHDCIDDHLEEGQQLGRSRRAARTDSRAHPGVPLRSSRTCGPCVARGAGHGRARSREIPPNEPTREPLGHWLATRLLTAEELAAFEREGQVVDRAGEEPEN
jgi:hypothetical protein